MCESCSNFNLFVFLFWDVFGPSFWSPNRFKIDSRSLRRVQGLPRHAHDRLWSSQEPPKSLILVFKIVPKSMTDRFEAFASSPHALKINFGAPKTCPTSRKVAWRLQDGFQTDLRFVANTSPKTSAMQFPLYNTHVGHTLHRRLFLDCELMLRVQRSQERVYSSQFVNHIRRFPLETRPLQQKLKTVFER